MSGRSEGSADGEKAVLSPTNESPARRARRTMVAHGACNLSQPVRAFRKALVSVLQESATTGSSVVPGLSGSGSCRGAQLYAAAGRGILAECHVSGGNGSHRQPSLPGLVLKGPPSNPSRSPFRFRVWGSGLNMSPSPARTPCAPPASLYQQHLALAFLSHFLIWSPTCDTVLSTQSEYCVNTVCA